METEETVEHGLHRMTSLVEQIFRVPAAYIALLGGGEDVTRRLGSGDRYWKYLSTYPREERVRQPCLVRDARQGLPPGADFGPVRFAATAPLRCADGLLLGYLVIASEEPRPDFSEKEHAVLCDLATVFAGKIELRDALAKAQLAQRALQESEERFRAIADCTFAMILCSGADGDCYFVNRAWLEFTGRQIQAELGEGWLDVVHKDTRGECQTAYWQALEQRAPFDRVDRMRRRDGEYRTVRHHGEPRFHRDGFFAGMVGTCTDITDCLESPQARK